VHPTGYAYRQFCERYRQRARALKPHAFAFGESLLDGAPVQAAAVEGRNLMLKPG
jgi:hypothetical protein